MWREVSGPGSQYRPPPVITNAAWGAHGLPISHLPRPRRGPSLGPDFAHTPSPLSCSAPPDGRWAAPGRARLKEGLPAGESGAGQASRAGGWAQSAGGHWWAASCTEERMGRRVSSPWTCQATKPKDQVPKGGWDTGQDWTPWKHVLGPGQASPTPRATVSLAQALP